MSDPFIDRRLRHDKALRGRVKLLGRLLGDALRRYAGETAYPTIKAASGSTRCWGR